jgi:hypothetical protein
MIYKCGHEGCDICGGRTCAGLGLKIIGNFIVCDSCIHKSIKISYDMACYFGGTTIDTNKPCMEGK